MPKYNDRALRKLTLAVEQDTTGKILKAKKRSQPSQEATVKPDDQQQKPFDPQQTKQIVLEFGSGDLNFYAHVAKQLHVECDAAFFHALVYQGYKRIEFDSDFTFFMALCNPLQLSAEDIKKDRASLWKKH